MQPIFRKFLELLPVTAFLLLLSSAASAQSCSTCASVTTVAVDLSANADTTWSTASQRNGQCCQGAGSDKCIVFQVTVSPRATEIRFIYKNGSANNGSYEINCDPATQRSPGTPQCLGGLTTFCITFCAPGNATDNYTITTSSGFAAGPDITLQGGCAGQLVISGLLESSLTWTSIYPGAAGAYNSWLSCNSGCDTTVVTPVTGGPAYVDYKACGTRTGCTTGTFCDTQRVYTVPKISVSVSPVNPVVCLGQPNPTLTATPSGGKPPYSFAWSTGATSPSVTVPAGTYSVTVNDATTCSGAADTVTVTTLAPATANAGPDITDCSGNTIPLSGSIGGSATSSRWTTMGTGSFNDSSIVAAVYTPSAQDIVAGSVDLVLTASGSCADISDTMSITLVSASSASAGIDQSSCANNANIVLSGSSTSGSGSWSSGGTGSFSPGSSALNATYIPSAADISSGSVTLSLITTNNGSCPADTDAMTLSIAPAPVVNAGNDQTVCASSPAVALNGSVTNAGGATWSGGNGSFNPGPSALNATYTPAASEISTGSVTLHLTSTGNANCNAVSDTVVITIMPALSGTAGTDKAACRQLSAVAMNASLNIPASILWSSSGNGVFSPNNTTLNSSYTPSAADTVAGSVTLTLHASNTCSILVDSILLTFVTTPSVNAGIDQQVCAGDSVHLNGSVSSAISRHWTSSGSGTFIPNDSALNATYIPGAGDKTTGSVTLTLTAGGSANCNAADAMTVTINHAPVVQAGNDIPMCTVGPVILNGQVAGGITNQWSTTGSGSFTPNNTSLNATYQPGASDTAFSSISLILQSVNGCGTSKDTLMLRFGQSPSVNAGSDLVICASDTIASNASVAIASNVQWSTTGTGTFIPNNTTVNAGYLASPDDELAGGVSLILTATNTCGSASDTVNITLLSAPFAYAGTDQTICAGYTANLNPWYTGASVFHWHTTGTGSFTPNDSDDYAVYNSTPADIAAGSVTIYMTVTNSCGVDVDSMRLGYYQRSTATAGNDTTICEGSQVQLNGSVIASASSFWITSGNGTFAPNSTALNATYIPGSADIANGSVQLKLRPVAPVNCPVTPDSLVVTIIPAVSVQAGNDITLCSAGLVNLNGQVTGGSTQQWTTSGDGIFVPNDSTLNAVYQAGATDWLNGSATLSLSSSSTCGVVVDSLQLFLQQAPSVNAGSDQVICAADTIVMNASASTNNVQWTSTGTGTFFPDNTSVNARYLASSDDELIGSVSLILTAGNTCGVASDTVDITLLPEPFAYAGTDQTICAGYIANLNPWYTNAPGFHWHTTGTGSFSPNDSDDYAVYVSSQADVDSGSVTLYMTVTNSCSTDVDSMRLGYYPRSTAAAGNDTTICAGSPVQLNGSVVASSGSTWITSGDGTFSPNTSALNAIYTPGTADIANGSVQLKLRPTAPVNCPVTPDSLIVTIIPAVTVQAGSDVTLCTAGSVNLNGQVAGGLSQHWTSTGDGTFSPNDSALNAVYQPGTMDWQNGTADLVLSSSNACSTVSDSLLLTMQQVPTADAGTGLTVCSGDSIALNGTVTGTINYQWTSSGTGSFVPNANSLNTYYQASAGDALAGSVVLTLSASNSCGSAQDTIYITLLPMPVANAGADISVCPGDSAMLNGSVSGSSSYQWSTLGNGVFSPSAGSLNANYQPGSNDLLNGSVLLVLTATGSCGTSSDTLTVTLNQAPTASAGPDQSVCGSNPVSLTPYYSNAAGFHWRTSGSGVFLPNDSDITASYIPSAADYAAGNVTLSVVAANSCAVATDSMNVAFFTHATAVAGPDQAICGGGPIQLNGSLFAATTSFWATSGGGTFIPNAASPVATYIPGPGDTAAGSVMLILIPMGSIGCPSKSDTMLVEIDSKPAAAFMYSTPCANASTQFTDLSSVGHGTISSWSWISSTGTSTVQNPSFTYNSSNTENIVLIAGTPGGCMDTITQSIFINAAPVPEFTIQTFCPDTAVLDDISSLAGGSIASWSWDFGDQSTGSSQHALHTYSMPGDYNVTLTVVSDSGCSSAVMHSVHLDPCDDNTPVKNGPALPLAFTPNMDGNNDVLVVRGGPFISMDFSVYNEWGQEIFHSDSQSAGWDGTFHNKQQPDGKYVWTLTCRTTYNVPYKLTGQVLLKR